MTYVRNAWYVASWEQDLEVNRPLAISILGERIVIWRTESGSVYALEDRCVHRMAALSIGRCEGERLRCMYHGMLYDNDGRVVEIPGQPMVPATARVRTYPIVKRHSWIWVWMGDPGAADQALIPPAIGCDDPDYLLAHGSLDYEAEARLINDNLLDFSHLSYVHPNSFGVGMEFAESLPKITAVARGIRYERWTETSMAAAAPGADRSFDSYQVYDYLIPGILLMWFAAFPSGTAAKVGGGAPALDDAIGFHNYTAQAVTPMTERTSRYFFSTGPLRRLGDESVRDQWMARSELAFAEDKLMIETQQKVIDSTPNPVVMPTVHDKAVLLFNRLVKSMSNAEREEMNGSLSQVSHAS